MKTHFLITAGTLLTTFGTLHAQDPSPPPPPAHPMYNPGDSHEHPGFGDPMQMLTNRLKLSTDQQAKIKPIIDAALPVFKKIHEEEKAKMEGAMELAVSEVKATLNPDQQEELDRILEQMHEREMPGHGMPGPDARMRGGPDAWRPHADRKPASAPSASATPATP